MRFLRWVLAALFLGLFFVIPTNSAWPATLAWTIKKPSWTDADEKNYSNFVQTLGSSSCNTVDRCMKSPQNPYRGTDPAGAYWDADCAKFPYLLRSYFAWKNGLPFGYVNDVDNADGDDSDIRYSLDGNYVRSRRSLTQRQSGQVLDGMRALHLVQGEVDSAMFRIHPYRDGADKGTAQDFYPVHIDRDQIRPGTMVYDPDGHVVVIYKIENDGRVRYFDAHPDKTISHGVFGQKFARSRPGAGAGFKNFRSLKLVGYTLGGHGELLGGQITADSFAKTPGYSVEQFWGTEMGTSQHQDSAWLKAKFKINGRALGYYDFVRARLAVGELKYHPIEEMQNGIDALCGDLHDRALAVQTGFDAGIQNKSHPDRLPQNIYGTSGEWEEFSTPSRDARLKTSFLELRQRVQDMVELYRKGDPSVDYQGSDLAGDLRAAYSAASASCSVEYKRTDGSVVTLDYDTLASRLFALSFDPYHCVELRWGATSSSELATCRMASGKGAWYTAEQRLRNQLARAYNARMNFSLSDLQRGVSGSGVDQAPDVNLKAYLRSL